MDVEVTDVSQLLVLKSELVARLGEQMRAGEVAITALHTLVAECESAVSDRRAALERCLADEDRRCDAEQASFDRAVQAQRQAATLASDGARSARTFRTRSDELAQRATAKLTALHDHLAASPASGAASGGGGSGPGSDPTGPPGHLQAEALASLAGAATRYAEEGDRLNGALWAEAKNGTALSADDTAWAASLDSAIESAAPATSDAAFHRSTGSELLRDLGCDPSDTAGTTAVLDSGPAARHPAFMSVSEVDPFKDADGYTVHMTVHVDAGSSLLDLRGTDRGGVGLSPYRGEREFLLPRSGHLLVVPGSARAHRRGSITHYYFDARYVSR